MLSWVEYRRESLERIGEIGQITSDTVRGYKMLSTVTMGSLDAKMRELIALTVAVTARCDGCITVYTVEATKHGATHEEIVGTLNVVISFNAGVALMYSVRVLDTVQAYEEA